MSTAKGRRSRPRTSSKTSPARLRAVERQAAALKLRADGLSLAQIAVQLGYRGRQGAHDAITRGLVATLQEPADTVRKLDTMRLDGLWRRFYAKAERGSVSAAHVCIRILERRAKLLGLDAPQKLQADVNANHTGGVLVVPGVMTAEAWSQAAAEHSEQLEAAETTFIRSKGPAAH